MSLDAAALQVLIARLSGVAEEMGAVLRRLTPPRPASPRVCW